MEGRLLGSYRVGSELGSGGMGTVYRAQVESPTHGLEPGTSIALKIIHPHLLARGDYLERFHREAEIGTRIRNVNVVDVLAAEKVVDGEEQLNFLVMEYVEGRTLRVLQSDLGTVPETLLREIARQVAGGLAAIHEAGIVHRDVKPENILLTRDDQVRIMDLGLAKVVEESIQLTTGGDFAGSLQYAAPEQYGDARIGPWTDLYSLGVVLHELATGVNPFKRSSPAAVMMAHLKETPPPAQEANPEISAFLSTLLVTLLSKDPEDRIRSAADLVRILELGEWSEWWRSREGEILRAGGRPPKVVVRREARLCGRKEDLADLEAAWRKARAGDGNAVLIEGEPGIGKTRLIDEFLRRVSGPDTHVLYGAYGPLGEQSGLSESILEHFGSSQLAEALLPYLTAAPALAPAFVARVLRRPPPEGSEALSGDALAAAVCHLMRGLAAEKPVVWTLEDLHLADAVSRRIFLSMVRAAVAHPVLVLATARPGMPESELSNFARLDYFRRRSLGRLGAGEVIELLREVLKSDTLTDRLGAKVAEKSDGVPFFVLEIVQSLKDRGLVNQRADGTFVATGVIHSLEVPSAVRSLVETRLSELSDEDRSLLDLAAVLGAVFDPDLLARAREVKRVNVLERLASLERRTGLVRSRSETFCFDQRQVQEVLCQDLPPGLRAEYHTMLADARRGRDLPFAEDPGPPPGEVSLFLATHYLQGVQPRRAGPFLTAALQHLGHEYRHEALLEIVDRALEVEGLLTGGTREDVLYHKASSLDYLGRREEERAALDEVVRLADASSDTARRVRARRRMGWNRLCVSSPEEAHTWLTEAADLARGAEERTEYGLATLSLGNVSWSMGRYEDSLTCYRKALEIAEETADRRMEARARGNLGNLARLLGRHEEARRHYEQGAEIFREIGDRMNEGAVKGNLGNVFGDLGLYAEARPRHDEAISIAKEIGDRPHQAIALLNKGSHHLVLGDPEGARQILMEALAILTEIGARLYEGYVLHYLGQIAEVKGEEWEATRLFGEAVALFREIRHPSGTAAVLMSMGRLQEGSGLIAEARASFRDARRLAEDLGEPAPLVLALGHLAALTGSGLEEATEALASHEDRLGVQARLRARSLLHRATGEREHIEEARRLLHHVRDHAPPEFRESVIENVPLHREVDGSPERG